MNTKAMVGRAALAAVASAAMFAPAGIKYWDNQAYRAFDVDCYVQNGLVLNYDGIRNDGATAGHNPDATVWKNLGTGGAAYDMVKGGAATSSCWGDKGYVFAGDAYFKSGAKQALPEYYEIQTLVDAKAGDASGIGYVYTRVFADSWNTGDTAWNGSSIAVRPTWSQTVSGTTYKGSLVFNTHYYSNGRPMIPSTVTAYDYATALGDSKSAALFTGLEAPTEMPGRASPQSGSWAARSASYLYLGGHDNGDGVGEALKGTVKSFRYYSRILSVDERAWNRVVDEARYFHRRAALPVTNVVVASHIPIIAGDEPAGCYAVEGSHVFSAPASKVVKGRTYTLDGYTLETWNGSAWGAAVGHDGETSYTASDAALVRLTWRWTAGDGLVRYDADDYVQYGLVLNYDGIRNTGLGAAHDSAATTWANLGSGGSAYDMKRYSLVSSEWAEGSAAGSWTEQGFAFNKNSVFNESEPLLIQTKRTMQVLVDAKASAQGGIADVVGCYDGTKWDYFSICMRSNGTIANSFYIPVFGSGNVETGARPAIYSEGAAYDYGTAIIDGNDAVWFAGTTAPWGAADTGGTTGHLKKSGLTMTELTDAGISLGGRYPSLGQRFAGTIKSFRFYNRCLTDAEVAWNRVVDDWRYAAARVTNVVVASSRFDVQGNEPDGVYEVAGSYTFTAPESVTVGKITYAPAGHAIQAWDDVNNCWGAATEHAGSSYAYTAAVGKVRLLWRWKAVRGIRAATDYDVSDYVAGGLLFHLDGIRNAGAAAAHAEAPAAWANLGTSGAAGDAAIRAGDAERVVNWTEKGFRFDGNTRFFATIPYTTTFTLQFCTDAAQNDQHNPDSSHMYPFTADNNGFAVSTYDTRLYFRTQGNGAEYALGFAIDKARPIGYVTAMLDDATKTARIFPGTTSSSGGSRTYDSMSATRYANLTLGGGGSGASQFWNGTINYFRYYDRVLSDAELAQNREVDQARYFGALGVTNVLVVAGGGTQAETGAYKVEGEWTFSAETVSGPNGSVKSVLRHTIEEFAGGKWTNRQTVDGASYTYRVGESPSTVRLTWKAHPLGFTIQIR